MADRQAGILHDMVEIEAEDAIQNRCERGLETARKFSSGHPMTTTILKGIRGWFPHNPTY